MKKIILSLLFLLNSFSLALSQTFISGKVVRVADGDSFTLLDESNTQIRVRLHGIDCPEYKQDFSAVAKKFTSERIFGEIVKVQVTDIDRYQRVVGIVFLPNGLKLNNELLKAGLAWQYRHYDKSTEYEELERNARRNKLGLWAHPNPVPPWEFRRLRHYKTAN